MSDNERNRPSVSAEERYRLFAENATDYAFITFDTENRVTSWSKGAEHILGYSEADILGATGAIFFTEEDRARGKVEKELKTALHDGRAEDERWHLRKDRSRFWASGVMTPFRDESGHLLGFAKVMRDLTERKLAQERWRESEERFRLFVENVTDYALFRLDEEGHISGWNTGAERIFGYSEGEILGQPFERLFCPEDWERARQELQTTLRDGRAEDERWVVRKDGKTFFARWVTYPIRDDGGVFRGFAKVLRDETHRKQEELRALAAELMRTQEEEQRRIARELHDGLAQNLALLEMDIHHLRKAVLGDATTAQKLTELQTRVGMLSQEVRELSHRLHPSTLDHLGFEVAIRGLVEEFSHAGLPLRLDIEDLPSRVPVSVGAALYRITQEALRNVLKHGGDGPSLLFAYFTPEKRSTLPLKTPGVVLTRRVSEVPAASEW